VAYAFDNICRERFADDAAYVIGLENFFGGGVWHVEIGWGKGVWK